jgi:hypothetical protein
LKITKPPLYTTSQWRLSNGTQECTPNSPKIYSRFLLNIEQDNIYKFHNSCIPSLLEIRSKLITPL